MERKIDPKQQTTEERADFEELTIELVNPEKAREEAEYEEWVNGGGNPPPTTEFTIK